MTRTLALCADDFGQSTAIDDGILRLLAMRRLTAVSCLTGGPAWRDDAPQLLQAAGLVQLGLHFNLTDGRPLAPALASIWSRFPSLSRLIAAAHLGRLPRAAMRQELAAQIVAFEAATDRQPDYLDGHRHVHGLPGVRDLVLGAAMGMHPQPALRSTAHVAGRWFKGRLIEATGGRALGRELASRGLRHNRLLLGAYDFEADYRPLMRGWLAEMPSHGGLLFCHPGEVDDDPTDPIGAARVRELAYLSSDAFAEDLMTANVTLGHVW